MARNGISGLLIQMGVIASGSTIAIVAAALFLFAVTIKNTGWQRSHSDCMFGFGGELLPVPLTKVWYDYGYGDGGLNGRFFISSPTPEMVALGAALYYAVNGAPTGYWTPF